LIIFSDILFDSSIIERILKVNYDITLVVDNSFKISKSRNKKLDLVRTKYRPVIGDRKITFDRENPIVQIGKEMTEDEADYEFIGMAMFSPGGVEIFKKEYSKLINQSRSSFHEAASFSKASFTDMIQHLIDSGITVSALEVHSGWMEIHTFENYKRASTITKTL
ncbi:MAG: hypothetical protein ACE5QV_07600, partial [Fidelibacterota bacterium]